MRYILKIFYLACLTLLPLCGYAEERIRVVATTPDLADITERIGGDLVQVSRIATGVEDPHGVPMKPSFATMLNRADLLILQGLNLEDAFLPGLLEAARNPKIKKGGPGYIDCSINVVAREIPTQLDRAMGEQHPLGNPHYNLDPVAARGIVDAIADGLSKELPQHKALITENRKAYLSELESWIERWRAYAAPLKGVRYVSYHPDLIYLAARYGMEQAGTIELRAGVDATPSHIAGLEAEMKSKGVKLVIREKHYPAELAQTIAQATGATLVDLPIMSGGLPETKSYISFIDYNLRQLVAAVHTK